MKQVKWIAYLYILFFSVASVAAQKKKVSTKIDHIALASVLIRDGHLDRAKIVLLKFKRDKKGMQDGTRRAHFYMLMGIIQSKKGLSGSAIRSLSRAISLGIKKPLLYLLLAQGYFRLARYKKALETLSQAPSFAQLMRGTFFLKAQSLWRLKRHLQAYAVLSKGYKRHPSAHTMLKLQALVMIELQLAHSSFQKIQKYLQVTAFPLNEELTKTYLMFAGAYHRQKLPKMSILLLEEARLVAPRDTRILVQLARVYLDIKQTRTAASLLERAAWQKPTLMIEASEIYRRAGMFWHALYLNAQVTNQKKKMKQRLGLLIELQRFEEAAALAPRLSRLGLLNDQSITYAIAFSFYKTGRYKESGRWLKRLSSRTYFRKAIILRKAMQSCSTRQWWCP